LFGVAFGYFSYPIDPTGSGEACFSSPIFAPLWRLKTRGKRELAQSSFRLFGTAWRSLVFSSKVAPLGAKGAPEDASGQNYGTEDANEEDE